MKMYIIKERLNSAVINIVESWCGNISAELKFDYIDIYGRKKKMQYFKTDYYIPEGGKSWNKNTELVHASCDYLIEKCLNKIGFKHISEIKRHSIKIFNDGLFINRIK